MDKRPRPTGNSDGRVKRLVGRSRAASPLRYPGGKAALAGFFANIIEQLDTTSPIYVEPYAGGAGAGISLVIDDLVEDLVINDIDPAVCCFWRAITEQADEFIGLLETVPLCVEEWRKQKEIYRYCDETDYLELGFAFFYLNRTNRSGVLHAGPIGGVKQNGNFKIDARFNRDQLVERVRRVGNLRKRIHVLNEDGRAVAERYAQDRNAFTYIDPPYVNMGGTLYLNAFTHRDHSDLALVLHRHRSGNWLLTYDDSAFVRKLYEDFDVRDYSLSYSAHRAGKGLEVMIPSCTVSPLIEPRSLL